MTHSRKKLQSFTSQIADRLEHQKTVQDLINKVLRNKNITLAEEQFVCSIIRQLRDENDNIIYKIKDLDYCKNFRFRNLYMLYFIDLNGHKTVVDLYGIISLEQKKEDVAYLEREYQEWSKKIEVSLNQNDLLSFITQETKQQIKEIKKYCSQNIVGSRYKDYLIKSMVLHSKYIYLTVKEAFEEFGSTEKLIKISGKDVLINEFCYVHTMFRHYSKTIKFHQINKSYHFDEKIDFRNIPTVIEEVLTCFKNEIDPNYFDEQKIFVEINGSPYAIWFKKVIRHLKGNIQKEEFRTQTFYPIKEYKEIQILKKKTLLKTKCSYSFWV